MLKNLGDNELRISRFIRVFQNPLNPERHEVFVRTATFSARKMAPRAKVFVSLRERNRLSRLSVNRVERSESATFNAQPSARITHRPGDVHEATPLLLDAATPLRPSRRSLRAAKSADN